MNEIVKAILVAVAPVLVSEVGQTYRQRKTHEEDRRKENFERRLDEAMKKKEEAKDAK